VISGRVARPARKASAGKDEVVAFDDGFTTERA
jgi:hypothetical protein